MSDDIERTSISEGKNRRRKPGEMPTRKNAIRLFCLECTGWNQGETRRCTNRKCWLWPYRMGAPATDDVAAENGSFE